jgi:hypothetical protein
MAWRCGRAERTRRLAGGEHAGNKLAMQEFMILPTGAAVRAAPMRPAAARWGGEGGFSR